MSDRPQRQLAAIMFADMVGFTALMQRDERRAIRARDRYRAALTAAVAEHGGTTVQHYGDGALTIFPSAIEAVRGAVSMQAALNRDDPVSVRVGIHTGDIVRDADGVYGDGVNLAARLQALATPGSVVVSDRVQDDLKNQTGWTLRFLGRAPLKNVERPVGVWSVEAPGLEAAAPVETAESGRDSVAVLPFLNLARDPDNEFFSDGVSEEIINALTRVPGLKVTSRTSSFAFKGRNADVREIAEQLGVATVLEGSVRRSGEMVRVTAQLIDAGDGYHLFSRSWDRRLEDIFAIQDEIAAEIVRELTRAMGRGAGAPVASRPVDLESYQTVLRARHFLNQWSPESALRAVQLYEHAIETAPEYAAAHSGLANVLCYIGALGRQGHRHAWDRAAEHARTAIALDGTDADAHVALGLVALLGSWDRHDSLRHFERALELNPGSGWVHHIRAVYHMLLLDPRGALSWAERARDLDPLSQPIQREIAQILMMDGQPHAAIEQLERALELAPTFRTALESLGWFHVALGQYEEARGAFERYAALSPSPWAGATQLGYLAGRTGDEREAQTQLARLQERAVAEPDIRLEMDFATLHVGTGDLDEAFRWANQAVDVRLGGLVFGLISSIWEGARPDPRFGALIDRVGLWAGVEERWRGVAR